MSYEDLHIVHILPSLGFGGAERCVVDIINNSSPRFRYTVLLLKNHLPLADEITAPQYGLGIVPPVPKINWQLVRELRSQLQQLKPDIIHTHLFGADLWGRLAARPLHTPIITTEHNLNIGESGVRNFVRLLMRNYSTDYVACSQSVAAYMRQTYKISKPIEVIRYGINIERFQAIAPPQCIAPWRIVMLGRLVKQKGFDIGCSALALLTQYPWEVTIVGEGEEKNNLTALVEQLGLQGRVRFRPFTHDVPGVLAASDILFVPSRWEGLGIVAMEAMAAGRLVVASPVDGLGELMEDGVTGAYAENGSPAALAERLRWCFENPQACKNIAQAGQEFASSNFGVYTMVRKYEERYLALAAK